MSPAVPAERGAGDQVVEWRQFEVGQRVRIRINPECPNFHAGDSSSIPYRYGHHESANTFTGTVVKRFSDLDDHRYWVRYDGRPRQCGTVIIYGSCYAAAELEPAGAPPPGADGSEG